MIDPSPEITLYQLYDRKFEIRPAQFKREWMDNTSQHFAYRCIPLSIANASGWEVLNPITFDAFWNGGPDKSDIKIGEFLNETNIPLDHLVKSHFGHGTITFHIPYLIKTTPGWALWVRGAPNTHKPGIVALDGLVETDWLPFTFTMNWRFTEPGPVRFDAGDVICFFTLFPHSLIDGVQPVIKKLSDEPKLHDDYHNWADRRREFIEKKTDDWQKYYVRGKGPDDIQSGAFHVSKRRLKEPKNG